jgi:hypothetical protein
MGARGKKSVAALSVIAPAGITAVQRPEAPADLTAEQAEEWLEVVNRMPADWFPRETHRLLVQYCCHVVQARYVAQMIGSLLTEESGDLDFQKDNWLADYDRLLKMQEREGRAMTALARGMRMTQHSAHTNKKGRGSVVKKPHQM